MNELVLDFTNVEVVVHYECIPKDEVMKACEKFVCALMNEKKEDALYPGSK